MVSEVTVRGKGNLDIMQSSISQSVGPLSVEEFLAHNADLTSTSDLINFSP